MTKKEKRFYHTKSQLYSVTVYDRTTQKPAWEYGGERFEIYYCHSYAAWETGCKGNPLLLIHPDSRNTTVHFSKI